MTLLQLRTKFVDTNGRHDLVVNTSAYADNGADFFINAGVKLLDRLTSISDLSAIRSETLAIDGYTMNTLHAKAIDSVSFINADDEIVYLTKMTMRELREAYPELENTDSGTPVHYALYMQRTFASDTEATPDGNKGIMIMPPTDEAITINITGKFKSKTLSIDTDVNFWTIMYPELLIKAANYELEVMYRNSEGARDWMLAITDALRELDHDVVEEDIAEITYMEDSYVP